MTEQEKLDLIITINEFPSSKWSFVKKTKILSQYKTDKEFQQEIIQAFIEKQLQETETDPLEDKVCDQNGDCLASRAWECHARNCSYQPCRANCSQLKIEVSKAESLKLMGLQKYACLRHYIVDGESSDFCHRYFKENKQLPPGAKLNIKLPKQLLELLQQQQQPSTSSTILVSQPSTSSAIIVPEPSTSSVNFEAQQDPQNESVNDGSLRKEGKIKYSEKSGRKPCDH